MRSLIASSRPSIDFRCRSIAYSRPSTVRCHALIVARRHSRLLSIDHSGPSITPRCHSINYCFFSIAHCRPLIAFRCSLTTCSRHFIFRGHPSIVRSCSSIASRYPQIAPRYHSITDVRLSMYKN